MSNYFLVTSAQGIDVHAILQDNQGDYLGSSAQTFGQGSILEIDREVMARLTQSAQKNSKVFQLKNKTPTKIGVDSSLGVVCISGSLRLTSGMQAAADVEVVLSPTDLNRLESSSGSITISAIVTRDKSLISNNLQILEINGSDYEITKLDTIQGAASKLLNRNDTIDIDITI